MGITGDLRTLELAEILQWLGEGRKTGTLNIGNGTATKSISFKNGRIIASASSEPKERLGRILVDQGYIDQATLEHALKLSDATRNSVGKVLVSLGSISEVDLERLLRHKTEESIYELFFWPKGEFDFQQEEPSRLAMVPLSLDVTRVVMEGLRRLDEWKAGNGVVGEPPLGTGDAKTVVIDPPPPLSAVRPASPPATGAAQGTEGTGTSSEEVSATVSDSRPWVETVGARASQAPPAGSLAEKPAPVEVEESDDDSGVQATKSRRAVVTSVAASLVVFAVLGWAWVSSRASEPERLARQTATGRPHLAAGVTPTPDSAGRRMNGSSPDLEPSPVAGNEQIGLPAQRLVEVQLALPAEDLTDRYEEELASLRQQLAAAQRLAAEREQALRVHSEGVESSGSRPEAGSTRPTGPRDAPFSVTPAAPVSAAGPEPVETTESPARRQVDSAVEADAVEAAGLQSDTLEPTGVQAGALQRSGGEQAAPPPELWRLNLDRPKEQEFEIRLGDLVEPGPGVVPPRLVRRPSPRYPPVAERLRRQAKVRVQVLVDEAGKPAEVRRVSPKVGLGFDKEALRAARNTVWKPASKDGIKVKMWRDLLIEFRL